MNIVVPTQGPNNYTPIGEQGAADPTLFDVDPLQPGQTHLHSWMLYTSQAPVLDLTEKDIKATQDFEQVFQGLNLCSMDVQTNTPNGRKETGNINKFK